MSLVAYGSSDESEEESEKIENVQNAVNKSSDFIKDLPTPRPTSNAGLDVGVTLEVEDCSSQLGNRPIQSLFHSLPKPKQNICAHVDEDEQLESHADVRVPPGLSLLAFIPEPQFDSKSFRPRPTLGSSSGKDLNKKLGPVKITVPSLSQFSDEKDDEPVKKKLKPSQKGSGLFAILPAPKNIKQRQTPQQLLVPYILSKKLTPTTVHSKHINTSSQRSSKPPSTELGLGLGGNDSEDDEDKDFFSLNVVHNASNETTADLSGYEMHTHRFSPTTELETDAVSAVHCSNEKPLAFHSGFLPSPWVNESPLPGPSREGPRPMPTNCQDLVNNRAEEWTSQEPNNSFQQENLQLDAEAMQRLCGRRSKKQEPVEFIDVSGKEIMPDPKDWLVKQLSEEQPKMRSHSHKRNDGPTTQQRRKHQITYLAFQAKENELELKNQWSQNRMSRKQTQSKYGF